MGGTQTLVPSDIQKYHLPIGLLGLVNQLVNIYILLAFTCARRPLWPWHPMRHYSYSSFLCSVTMVLAFGLDVESIRRLDHWELTTSVVGNMILLVSYIGMSIGGCHGELHKEATGPQANAVQTSRSTATGERRKPRYSQDLERCETALNEETKGSGSSPSEVSESDVVGVPENPTNRVLSKDADVMETLSTSTTIREEQPEPQTLQKAQNTDTNAVLFMLIFNMPGTVLVFAGLVGHLSRNLPADWRDIEQLRTIVITFSIFLAGTVLCAIASGIRSILGEDYLPKDVKPKKLSTWQDAIFLGSIVLGFFVVSFDKWLLAALAGDIRGTKHILSDGGLTLVYMILTKLPALAL